MSTKLEWRCSQCGKLMGVCNGQRVHIRFQQGHEYMASLPVAGICRHCGTLNDLPNCGPHVGPCNTRLGD
jgi:hypothetical protein